MNMRIHALRKELGISQTEFGKKINISGPAVAKIESGKNSPSDQTITLICDRFNVNREWLAYGIEPMRPTQSDSDIVLITRAMEGQNENKKKLIRIMADMPDELLDKMMEYLESKLK